MKKIIICLILTAGFLTNCQENQVDEMRPEKSEGLLYESERLLATTIPTSGLTLSFYEYGPALVGVKTEIAVDSAYKFQHLLETAPNNSIVSIYKHFAGAQAKATDLAQLVAVQERMDKAAAKLLPGRSITYPSVPIAPTISLSKETLSTDARLSRPVCSSDLNNDNYSRDWFKDNYCTVGSGLKNLTCKTNLTEPWYVQWLADRNLDIYVMAADYMSSSKILAKLYIEFYQNTYLERVAEEYCAEISPRHTLRWQFFNNNKDPGMQGYLLTAGEKCQRHHLSIISLSKVTGNIPGVGANRPAELGWHICGRTIGDIIK